MVREIPLTKGYVALVDDEDFERVGGFKWTAMEKRRVDGTIRVYAYRKVEQKSVYLHRVIMAAPAGFDVDHEDGDGLNCVRSNMRLSSRAQNLANQRRNGHNTSGYKGVSATPNGRWYAHIGFQWQKFKFGTFDAPEFAAAVYDAAARHFHGPFALTNFPDRNPDAEAIIAARFAESEAA
jgi:hypothetical protein